MNNLKLGILAAGCALLQITGQAASPPDFVRVEVKASHRWWEASTPTINIKMNMLTTVVHVESVEWYRNGIKVAETTNLLASIPFEFGITNECVCSMVTSIRGQYELDVFVAASTPAIVKPENLTVQFHGKNGLEVFSVYRSQL